MLRAGPLPGLVIQVVVHHQIAAAYPACHWPDHPVTVKCQFCSHTAMTHVEEQKGTLAWILFLVMCLVGCWLGCCCIPFCIPACNDQTHTCHHCHKVIGMRKSMNWAQMPRFTLSILTMLYFAVLIIATLTPGAKQHHSINLKSHIIISHWKSLNICIHLKMIIKQWIFNHSIYLN